MVDEIDENNYPSYLVNRALSYYPDTIFYANEINTRSHIDNKLAYDYYLNSIRPRKRFSKWFKKEDNELIDIIKEYYNVKTSLAIEYLSILNEQQINELRRRLFKGDN